VPVRSSALLTDIIGLFPLQHGAAELVGYLALADDDLEVVMDETEESVLDIPEADLVRRVRLPTVTVTRR